MRTARLCALALSGALALGGCASIDPYDDFRSKRDPLEGFNRAVFGVNEVLDQSVFKPLAIGYETVVPELARWMIGNVFANAADLWTGVNQLLQGKPVLAASDLGRVAINTVFGFGGVADLANDFGLRRHREDFGQTLGVWGFGMGPYLVLPVFGPSSVRDGIGLALDWTVDPLREISSAGRRNNATLLRAVDTRASLLKAVDVIDGVALDKYLFIRDTYFQRRRNMVYDGEAPPDYGDD
ncbi:MAG: VacJ family lipoprotein [Burkholderiaceae bacterium]|nr:VacJ family lipoprotein [Burkholderiaceae bacterium]